ncbi:hypothetical protein TVAGG3_0563450, partial [Trichomonas vaginalis G3]|uniref:hypothetical protein n=1 Tax=Trichomonas vaginalis (strain ATCC PRA-98 / G3) TaxID=412133 RepID=UPI0021E54202
YTGNFYVREVYFSNLGDDGVINLNSADVKSLISSNSFENSSRNDNGGSIYIKEGQSSIRKVCSFGSKSTKTGKFCFIEVSDASTNINEIQDSSITYSNQGNLDGYQTIDLGNGNISFSQNNITRNYCGYNAAFGIGDGEGTISIKYSNIDENYATSRICNAQSKPTTYNSIVFTNNTVSEDDSDYPGMFHCWKCSATFENCFIATNKRNGCYLFGIYDYYRSGYTITVSNSYIDTQEKLFPEGQQVSIGQNKDISIELHLHSTELCPIGNKIKNLNKMISKLIHLKTIGESMTSIFL